MDEIKLSLFSSVMFSLAGDIRFYHPQITYVLLGQQGRPTKRKNKYVQITQMSVGGELETLI